MSKNKLQGLTKLDAIKAGLPPATARKSITRGSGRPLQILVPDETLRALKMKAAETDSTVRALILEALNAKGFPVPDDELVDRRRRN